LFGSCSPRGVLKKFLRLRRAGFHCEKLRPPASPAACEATKTHFKQLQMLGQNPLYSLTPIPYCHFFCICSTRASPHSDVTVIPQGIPWGFTLCSNKPKNQKNKKLYLADRGFHTRNLGKTEEWKFGNVQTPCQFGGRVGKLAAPCPGLLGRVCF